MGCCPEAPPGRSVGALQSCHRADPSGVLAALLSTPHPLKHSNLNTTWLFMRISLHWEWADLPRGTSESPGSYISLCEILNLYCDIASSFLWICLVWVGPLNPNQLCTLLKLSRVMYKAEIPFWSEWTLRQSCPRSQPVGMASWQVIPLRFHLSSATSPRGKIVTVTDHHFNVFYLTYMRISLLMPICLGKSFYSLCFHS